MQFRNRVNLTVQFPNPLNLAVQFRNHVHLAAQFRNHVHLAAQFQNWFAISQFLICAVQFRNWVNLQIVRNVYSSNRNAGFMSGFGPSEEIMAIGSLRLLSIT